MLVQSGPAAFVHVILNPSQFSSSAEVKCLGSPEVLGPLSTPGVLWSWFESCYPGEGRHGSYAEETAGGIKESCDSAGVGGGHVIQGGAPGREGASGMPTMFCVLTWVGMLLYNMQICPFICMHFSLCLLLQSPVLFY